MAASIKVLNTEEIIKKCERRITNMVKHLEKELKIKVFNKDNIKMIEDIRAVLNLEKVVAQLKTQSAVDLANLLSKTFKKVSVKIVPKLFEDILALNISIKT